MVMDLYDDICENITWPIFCITYKYDYRLASCKSLIRTDTQKKTFYLLKLFIDTMLTLQIRKKISSKAYRIVALEWIMVCWKFILST